MIALNKIDSKESKPSVIYKFLEENLNGFPKERILEMSAQKDIKETTGLDYTKENLAKFQKGELSQAETKINGYKEGQDMATLHRPSED